MRVLIVKLTSMGDLIHLLPALTDAQTMVPGIEFDWVVDRAFSEVPTWHPSVRRVIKSSHRKWKKNIIKSFRERAIQDFYGQLRQQKYDLIIDAQSSIKSAAVSLLAKGRRSGMDASSARESVAAYVYHQKIKIEKQQHAIDRLRQLFAAALDYTVPTTAPDFSIQPVDIKLPIALPERYCVFVTNATWPTKCYPRACWKQLLQKAAAAGVTVLLPWGSEAEQKEVEILADGHENAQVLPRLPLTHFIPIFQRAVGAICVDTGLAHLAAALDTPAVTVYGPTDPKLIGSTGKWQRHLQIQLPCVPCYSRSCRNIDSKTQWPSCWAGLSPDAVWQAAEKIFVARGDDANYND